MTKRNVRASDIIRDIRAGLDDQTLMGKYRLSAQALQSLLEKLVEKGLIKRQELEGRMAAYVGTVVISQEEVSQAKAEKARQTPPGQPAEKKPVIRSADAVRDIREGMKDARLMEKYGLSARGLESLFAKLISAGLIAQWEIDSRISLSERTVDLTVYRCPACNSPEFYDFEECPACGVLVSKYKERRAAEATTPTTQQVKMKRRTFAIIPSQTGWTLTITGLNEELQHEISDLVRQILLKHGEVKYGA